MRLLLLSLLKCPACPGGLFISEGRVDDDQLETGQLRCEKCGLNYPVEEGIPRLLPPELGTSVRQSDYFEHGAWEIPDELPPPHMEKLFAKRHHRYDYYRRYLFKPLIRMEPRGPSLDAGCGLADTVGVLLPRQMASPRVGVDLAIRGLKIARERYGTDPVQGSMEALPFKSGCFSTVFSVGALHHCKNYRGAERELLRVLKEKGLLAVHEPVQKPSVRGGIVTEVPNSGGCYRFPEQEFFETLLNSRTVLWQRSSMTPARVGAHRIFKDWMVHVPGLMSIITAADVSTRVILGRFWKAFGCWERWYILRK